MDKRKPRFEIYNISALSLLIFIYAIRLIAPYFPYSRTWGFNHIRFLPDYWNYIYLALGLCVIAVAFISYRGIGVRFFDLLLNSISKRYYLTWLLLSLSTGLVFWLLRMPTNLLGDGYSVINNIGGDLPVVFKWSESGVVRIVYWVSLLLPYDGLTRGEYAFAIVSVISGAVFVYFVSLIAYEVAEDIKGRLLITGTAIFSGSILLFFGYAENYPILWPLSAAYILTSIRYIKGKCGIFIPAILILLGIYLHLQMVFFALSFPVLIFSRESGQIYYRKNKKTIWAVSIFLSGIFIYLFIHQYYSSIAFRSHILPLWHGKPITSDYAIISIKHFVDILNLFLLTVPLWPVLIIFAWKSRRLLLNDAINRFFLLFSAGGMIFVLLIDPRLGMARDWDLFALAALGPTLLLTRIYIQSGGLKYLYPVFIVASFVVTLPYLATNLKKEPSLAYMQSLLELDQSKSWSGRVMLRDYLSNNGYKYQADKINEETARLFPQTNWANIARGWLNAGQITKASAYADSIYNRDPYSADGYNIHSQIYIKLGKYDSALAMIKIAAELSPYESRAYTSMATIYRRMNNDSEMWEGFRRAQKLNPHEYSNLMLMSQSFANERAFDSAIAYIDTLKSNYPDSSENYLAAGVIYRAKGDYDSAIHELEIYVARLEDEAMQNNILRMIAEIKNLQK
ncbi:MAG: hypothetical protein V3V99_06480 [candidate division Zixibacteria bacterium]